MIYRWGPINISHIEWTLVSSLRRPGLQNGRYSVQVCPVWHTDVPLAQEDLSWERIQGSSAQV
jgi:hypothetical protein